MEEKIMENVVVAEEAAEEIVTTSSGKGVKTVVKVGLATLGGVIVYKRIIKPIIAKVKAKKAKKEQVPTVIKNVDEDDEEVKMIFDENGNAID